MRFVFFILFAFMCAIGCTFDVGNATHKNIPFYTVMADNEFTVDNKIAIAASLEEWNAKTENILKFDLIFVDKKQLKRTEDNSNIIYVFLENPDPKYIGWTSWNEKANGAYMLIAKGIDNSEFGAVMLHELGHAFHLAHSDDINSIMYPYLSDTRHLTCNDLTAFCREWECDPNCSQDLKIQNYSIVKENIDL